MGERSAVPMDLIEDVEIPASQKPKYSGACVATAGVCVGRFVHPALRTAAGLCAGMRFNLIINVFGKGKYPKEFENLDQFKPDTRTLCLRADSIPVRAPRALWLLLMMCGSLRGSAQSRLACHCAVAVTLLLTPVLGLASPQAQQEWVSRLKPLLNPTKRRYGRGHNAGETPGGPQAPGLGAPPLTAVLEVPPTSSFRRDGDRFGDDTKSPEYEHDDRSSHPAERGGARLGTASRRDVREGDGYSEYKDANGDGNGAAYGRRRDDRDPYDAPSRRVDRGDGDSGYGGASGRPPLSRSSVSGRRDEGEWRDRDRDY